MISVLEFPTFVVDANHLLTPEEHSHLITLLASKPDAGTVIRGTGGVRKLRIGLESKGKGKRGGGRVIYYFYNVEYPIALLALYAKGEKIDLTSAEKAELRDLVVEYTKAFKSRKAATLID